MVRATVVAAQPSTVVTCDSGSRAARAIAVEVGLAFACRATGMTSTGRSGGGPNMSSPCNAAADASAATASGPALASAHFTVSAC